MQILMVHFHQVNTKQHGENIQVSSVNVFKVNALLSVTLLENANYGKVKTTKKHIKRNDEVVPIEPFVCLENPRKLVLPELLMKPKLAQWYGIILVIRQVASLNQLITPMEQLHFSDGISIDDSYLFGST